MRKKTRQKWLAREADEAQEAAAVFFFWGGEGLKLGRAQSRGLATESADIYSQIASTMMSEKIQHTTPQLRECSPPFEANLQLLHAESTKHTPLSR